MNRFASFIVLPYIGLVTAGTANQEPGYIYGNDNGNEESYYDYPQLYDDSVSCNCTKNEQNIAELIVTLNQTQNMLNIFTAQITELDQILNNLTNQDENITGKLGQLEQKCAAAAESVESMLDAAKSQFEQKIANLGEIMEGQQQQLNVLAAENATTHRNMQEHNNQMDLIVSGLADVDSRLDTLDAVSSMLQENTSELRDDMAIQDERISELQKHESSMNNSVQDQGQQIEELDAKCAAVSDDLQTLEDTVGTIEDNIASLSFPENEPGPNAIVAFTAKLSEDLKIMEVDSTITFDAMITNVNSGYDNKTGVFTASIPGMYAFSLTIQGRCWRGTAVITKNGEKVGWVVANARYSMSSSGSVTVFLKLEQNDVVKVVAPLMGSRFEKHRSYFSGYFMDPTNSMIPPPE